MDAKVVWKSGLGFDGTADSGFMLPMGGYNEIGKRKRWFQTCRVAGNWISRLYSNGCYLDP